MPLRSTLPALLIAAMASGAPSCSGFGGDPGPVTWTWVATEPVQCLGNPWEQDWLARHGGDYASYPRDPAGQNAVIRAYYAALGIAVQEVISIPKYPVTCAACTCPRGDTLHLLVPEGNAPTMLELGYRLESPAPPG